MLILGNLDVNPLLSRPLRIFSTQEKALEHIRDHVLTPPESYCWSLVVPDFRSLFDAEQTREVNHLARQLFSNPLPAEAQSLYDGYADAIGQAVRDAIANGWYWQEMGMDGRPTWQGIGKSGILAVWDVNVVRTAYFKGYGARSRPVGKERPLPRKGQSPRKATPFIKDAGASEDTPAARFELFVNCWDSVRSEYDRACLERRRIPGASPMDRWRNKRFRLQDFQEWLAL